MSRAVRSGPSRGLRDGPRAAAVLPVPYVAWCGFAAALSTGVTVLD